VDLRAHGRVVGPVDGDPSDPPPAGGPLGLLPPAELGAHRAAALLQQVDEINMGQRAAVIDLALEACGGSVLNRRIGVLGAAFKPETDDVRDSPALNVAAALHLRGAQVTVFDPQAGDTARKSFPTLSYATSIEEAVEGSDVLLVLTEWSQFVDAHLE
jgi:UDPglucose 6-dehydrogenase